MATGIDGERNAQGRNRFSVELDLKRCALRLRREGDLQVRELRFDPRQMLARNAQPPSCAKRWWKWQSMARLSASVGPPEDQCRT